MEFDTYSKRRNVKTYRNKGVIMKEEFINLLKDTKREGIEDLIDYLENKTDFFKKNRKKWI